MSLPKVNGIKLRQALNRFGSLEKATESLQKEKMALEKSNAELKKEINQLKSTRDKLLTEVNQTSKKLNDRNNELQSVLNNIDEHKWQYQLFEGFLAMAAATPALTGSIESVVAALQKTLFSGWHGSVKPEELRTIFIRTIMGDYLRCFCCGECGAKFIVNKEPHHKQIYNYYQCPSCHNSRYVKADGSFLKAMVTEEQLENTRHVEELQKENDLLKPLKVFLSVNCEICHKPITEWSEGEVKMAISGYGWGHVSCWNSSSGQFLMMTKALQKSFQGK